MSIFRKICDKHLLFSLFNTFRNDFFLSIVEILPKIVCYRRQTQIFFMIPFFNSKMQFQPNRTCVSGWVL